MRANEQCNIRIGTIAQTFKHSNINLDRNKDSVTYLPLTVPIITKAEGKYSMYYLHTTNDCKIKLTTVLTINQSERVLSRPVRGGTLTTKGVSSCNLFNMVIKVDTRIMVIKVDTEAASLGINVND